MDTLRELAPYAVSALPIVFWIGCIFGQRYADRQWIAWLKGKRNG